MKKEITIRVDEEKKDKTGKKKKVLWVMVKTDKKNYESLAAVNELPDDSILSIEINKIVDQMFDLKKKELKKSSTKKESVV